MMSKKVVELTPSPQILATIAQNPMSPIDALSEIIDNSLDGFESAKDEGEHIDNPTITIEIPSSAEIKKKLGVLRISDNGVGLSKDEAVSAVTAGYSGQPNPLDRLGLYGMGFNISTAKLGQQTKFITRELNGNGKTSIIEINIPKMIKEKTFAAPYEEIEKSEFDHGVVIEISKWYARGSHNDGFIQALSKHSKPKLRELLGRRYSTLLKKGYTIIVNGEKCPTFNHCVWTKERFVTHKELGKIPAKIYIDENLGQEFRCSNCWRQFEHSDVIVCDNCDTEDTLRVIDKRISGWVGIQRFDDETNFGIDLIRNGRVIKKDEKAAFFTFYTSDNEEIKDYPIDSQYGRIIGEIDMSFVQVNYLKTDFDRTSPYWDEAMELLRGKTSLKPNLAKESGGNNSSIYKLFQGYRRVRDAGKKELYMGAYNAQKDKSSRISREVEADFYNKFLNDEPGYGPEDDSEWYKLVEAADERPVEGLIKCPKCNNDIISDSEECPICGHIIKSKSCIKCAKEITESALKCPHCGELQNEGSEDFWECVACKTSNPPDIDDCKNCGIKRGAGDPYSLEELLKISTIDDELSFTNETLRLPEDISLQLDTKVHLLNVGNKLEKNGHRIPTIMLHSGTTIEIFIDQEHAAFSKYQDRFEDYIAIELANFTLKELASRIDSASNEYWTLSNVYYTIHDQIWKDRTKLDHVSLISGIDDLFNRLHEKLEFVLKDVADQVFTDLTGNEKSEIYAAAAQKNIEVSDIGENGKFLRLVPNNVIPKIVQNYPEYLFDGKLWNRNYTNFPSDMKDEYRKKIQKQVTEEYVSALEDIIRYRYVNLGSDNSAQLNRVFHSLQLIDKSLD